MDKQQFLSELKKQISVLDEGEQRDILDEYSLHIDMSMQGGLSEEEAIHDFGDLRELAADILEAYHVNPNYGGRRVGTAGDAASKAKREFRKLLVILGQAGGAVRNFVSRVLPHALRAGASGIAYPFKKLAALLKKKRIEKYGSDETADSPGKKGKKRVSFRNPAGRIKEGKGDGKRMKKSSSEFWALWKKFWKRVCRGLRWCVRLLRNIVVLTAVFCTGLLSFVLILTFGISVVLLAVGYPFAGITLSAFGLAVCMVALTLLLWKTMEARKQGAAVKTEIAAPEEREVEYHA